MLDYVHNRQKALCIIICYESGHCTVLAKYNLLLLGLVLDHGVDKRIYFSLYLPHYRHCCGDNSDQCGCYSGPYCGHFTACYSVGNGDYAGLVQDTSQKHQETGEYNSLKTSLSMFKTCIQSTCSWTKKLEQMSLKYKMMDLNRRLKYKR